jgi:hypothetical protein
MLGFLSWQQQSALMKLTPTAEKLRADPWYLYVPKEEQENGDMVVFHRLGKGK